MGYERIINNMEAYEANRVEAKKVEELLDIILAKHPDERSLQDRLNINSLRKTAIQLAKKLREIERYPMSITQQLADKLHDNGCHKSHSDQCSYYYENKWTQDEHAKYLERATKIVAKIGEDETKRLLDLYDQKSGLSAEIKRIINLVSEFSG